MRNKKRVTAAVLSAMMLMSVSACGGSGDDTASTSGSSGSTGGYQSDYDGPMSLEEVASPTKDPLEKYDPEITVTTVHTGNDGGFWFPEGDSIEDNIYTRRYKEQLGINYEFLWTCPGSQASEKMNTMFVSGDLPDFMAVNRQQFEKLYAAGSLADITVPLIEYASEYTRQYLTGDYKGMMDAATKDGKYYGIPNGMAYNDGADMIWIRKDWLDKLGLREPETLEELEAIMEAFVTQDPDGNGEDDTYAIALGTASQTSADWGMNNAFFEMFNSYPNTWYANSKGEIEHGMFGEESREKTRAAIEKAAEYYEKGYLNPEFATMDADMRNADMFNGKCGVLFSEVWAGYYPLLLHLDTDPNADWIPVPVCSATDEVAKVPRYDAQASGILVATKDCEHPEALVKMTNLYHDLNNNPETMEFEEYNTNPSDNNQIFLAYPLGIYNPSFNYEAHVAIVEAQETGNTDNLCEAYKQFYDQAMSYEETGDAGGWPPYRAYLKEDSAFAVIDRYLAEDRIVFQEYNAEPTEFMIDNEPTVKKLYDEMIVSVITGREDISAYDEFLENWDSLYGDQATEEVRTWFEEQGGETVASRMAAK